jgi:hypothetical protein
MTAQSDSSSLLSNQAEVQLSVLYFYLKLETRLKKSLETSSFSIAKELSHAIE